MSTAVPSPDEHVWASTRRAWDVTFAVLLVAVAADFVVTGAGPRALAGLGALALWYLLTGVRAFRREGDGAGTVYLCGAYALFTALVLVQPSALLLLTALYPQTFALLSLRRAVAAAVLLATCSAAAQLAWTDWSWLSAAGVLLFSALSAGFAIALGVWIHRIIEQSRERAWLIAQLQSARDELARAHREQGVLAERQRLASEIHDTLAQGFASIVMLAQAAQAERGDGAGNRLGAIEATARESLAEARAMLAALSPVDLQGSSLPEALHRLAGRTSAQADLRVDVHVLGAPRQLAANSEIALLRAAQEALTNVRRHAGAGSVSVLLRYALDHAVLEVADDGCGFDSENVDGFGLQGMRRRAVEVGGHVDVLGSAGKGTTVRVTAP